MVQLLPPMYPCQGVPVVVYGIRCPKPCLYCDLFMRKFPAEAIIASGLQSVVDALGNYRSAYFSAVTDCFLPGNNRLTHTLIEKVWARNKNFVPLIVTKQIIPDETIELFIKNRHRIVVQISIPSVNDQLLSVLEPGAAAVTDRLATIQKLTTGDIPVIAVIMPWLDVYSDGETIEDLPRALAEVGVVRARIGTAVLPERQRQRMSASGHPLILKALERMTQIETVTTKTGDTLPQDERIAAFSRLINACAQHGIKARICTADNPDLIGRTQLPLCTKFKHPLFGKLNQGE